MIEPLGGNDLPFAAKRRLRDYEEWFRQLADFYLRARLRALGKTTPDENDLRASVAKASASLMAKSADDTPPSTADMAAHLAEIEAGNFDTSEAFLDAV